MRLKVKLELSGCNKLSPKLAFEFLVAFSIEESF